ncbi:MAG: EAL domain-containing protein [Gammaproteobacteria bacterium]|nr:EAL domain-containing protein [Gammaproteobacteria bacterium]
MKDTEIIRLLVLVDSSNEAEALVSALRNAGMAVRATHITSRAGLVEALEQQRWELVLAREAVGDTGVDEVLELLESRQKDIPLILLVDDPSELTLVQSLQAGAAYALAPTQTQLLSLVVEREMGALDERREHRRCRAALRDSEKRCRSLLENSRDAIAYVHDGIHLYANPVYRQLFGYDDGEDLEGMPMMDLVAGQDQARFKEFLRAHAREGRHGQRFEYLGERADGSEFDAVMDFSEAAIDGEPCTQVIVRPPAADTGADARLHEMRRLDLVTGLLNRDAFLELLNDAISAAAKGAADDGFVVQYLEVGNLGEIARGIGLAGVDVVLNDIAALLRQTLDAERTALARYADGAFTCLLRAVPLERAREQAEALARGIGEQIFDVTGRSVQVSVNIGLTPVGDSINTAQEALDQAHGACVDAAGRSGGSRVSVYRPRTEDGPDGVDETLGARLREALEQDAYALLFQPIVNLHGEAREYYEVLLRLSSGDGNLIPAGKFLPVAERIGLVADLDRWVVKRAVRVLADQHRSGFRTSFFITLSLATILDESFPAWLSQTFQDAHLGGDKLVFQIGTGIAADYLKPVLRLAEQLRELRCRITLTQFGTGLNPFGLLKHLDVEFLKLAPSFITHLTRSRENQETLESLVEEAHGHGKPVIAPQVEEASSIAILWQNGIDFTQGYFLQEPSEWLAYDFHGDSG